MSKPFTFWRENLIAQKFTLTLDEIKDKYKAWLQTKKPEWILYYEDMTVFAFLADKDGLNSVSEAKQSRELLELLEATRRSLPCYK